MSQLTREKLLKKHFKKIFVLDTNIILNQSSNIELISQNGDNLIILPEIVLDELDAKKSGLDEINFQARSFARLLSDAIISDKVSIDNFNFTEVKLSEDSDVILHIVTKEVYEADSANVDRKIINDRKILEVANDVKELYDVKEGDYIFLSIDIMARIRALSLGLKTETLKLDNDDSTVLSFKQDLEIENYGGVLNNIPKDIEPHISDLQILDTTTGKPYYYFKSGNIWEKVEEGNTKRVWSTPRNREQKALTEIILDDINDIIVVNGPAGCVMPGTNIDIETKEEYIPKEDFMSRTGLNELELSKLRKLKLIPFNKITNKIIEYDIGSYDSYVEKVIKMKRNNINKLMKENTYDSKYLKLSYWLKFLDENEAVEKVLFCRKYKEYFDIDFTKSFFKDFKNIEAVYKLKFKLLSFKYKSIFDINPSVNTRGSLGYWTMRGWTEEEAKAKVSHIQKEESKEKVTTVQSNLDFSTFKTNETELFTEDIQDV